jgi:o-succinylbenzoate---CoA ligase
MALARPQPMVARRAPRGRYARVMPNAATLSTVFAGDLVAVALPPGRAWLSIMRSARGVGFAVLPIHMGLAAPERDQLLERAQPTVIVDRNGMRRVDGTPVGAETALVIATSGTSGSPRLAELPHSAIDAAIRASAIVLRAVASDRWLSCLPLAHVGGMLVVYRHLLLGAPISFRSRLTAGTVAALPETRFTSMVPTQLTRLLDAGCNLHRFRAVLVGGSGMDGPLRDSAAAAGASVIQTYGMTETCGGVVYDGRPLPGVEVRASAAGELLCRGPTLMRGYRLDPEATASAFDAEGWLRTGDGGEVDRDGMVHVRGKLADVIVSGGEKIWPAEVEAALAGHPEVADVVVSASADREWGQRVVARVVPRHPSAPPSLASLRSHAAATIARHKLPRELILVERLDRAALGKVRRH